MKFVRPACPGRSWMAPALTATLMSTIGTLRSVSKDVSIGNNFTMTYKPVLVPGITGVTGFKQDISYIHE